MENTISILLCCHTFQKQFFLPLSSWILENFFPIINEKQMGEGVDSILLDCRKHVIYDFIRLVLYVPLKMFVDIFLAFSSTIDRERAEREKFKNDCARTYNKFSLPIANTNTSKSTNKYTKSAETRFSKVNKMRRYEKNFIEIIDFF